MSIKSEKTKKKKYGKDFHARMGAMGGSARGRGYFGKLKDEGRTEEIKALGRRGAEKSNKVQSKRRDGDFKQGENTFLGDK